MIRIFLSILLTQLLLLLQANANIAPNAGFVRVSTQAFPLEQNQYEIPNMPRFRSQDSIGMCASFSAATALDYVYCEENGISCQSVDDEQRFSTLHLNALNKPTSNSTENYSDPHEIMRKAIEVRSLSTESCASFEKVVNAIKTKKGSAD